MFPCKEQGLEGKLNISFCGLMPATHTDTNTLVTDPNSVDSAERAS